MGISGELYNLLENYLLGRFQKIILNGQNSSWTPLLAGVSQASILAPLLFLVYINDLPNEIKSNIKLYADDTSLFTIVRDKNESANFLTMTCCESLNGFITGKYFLIQVLVNHAEKCYLEGKRKFKFIQS